MKKTANFTFLFLIVFCGLIIQACEGEKKEKPTSKKEIGVVKNTSPVPVEEAPKEATGKYLLSANGCVACHQPKSKVVGPSLTVIAKAYESNPNGLSAFLKGKAEAIVDPDQKEMMAPFIQVTKTMDETERVKIVEYIMSGNY